MNPSAGAFVRRKRNELLVITVAGAGAIMGLSVGTVFHQLIGVWLGALSALGAVLVVAVVVLLSIRSLERRHPGNADSGEKAETLAAQVIEHALTAPDCALARSVVAIARARDIDHLVATPVRLWVIETKHRRGPRERFPEVLRRIADNTTAVWEWAPAGTPVRGCLVLADDAFTFAAGAVSSLKSDSPWQTDLTGLGSKRVDLGRSSSRSRSSPHTPRKPTISSPSSSSSPLSGVQSAGSFGPSSQFPT